MPEEYQENGQVDQFAALEARYAEAVRTMREDFNSQIAQRDNLINSLGNQIGSLRGMVDSVSQQYTQDAYDPYGSYPTQEPPKPANPSQNVDLRAQFDSYYNERERNKVIMEKKYLELAQRFDTEYPQFRDYKNLAAAEFKERVLSQFVKEPSSINLNTVEEIYRDTANSLVHKVNSGLIPRVAPKVEQTPPQLMTGGQVSAPTSPVEEYYVESEEDGKQRMLAEIQERNAMRQSHKDAIITGIRPQNPR